MVAKRSCLLAIASYACCECRPDMEYIMANIILHQLHAIHKEIQELKNIGYKPSCIIIHPESLKRIRFELRKQKDLDALLYRNKDGLFLVGLKVYFSSELPEGTRYVIGTVA